MFNISITYIEATHQGMRGFLVPRGLETLAVIGIGSAVASAVTGVAGSIASSKSMKNANQTNIALAEQANQQSLAQQREQNAFNKEMWDLNNQYNSLSAQLQRGREAGVNPNAVLGNSATSNPVQSVGTVPMQLPNIQSNAPQIMQGASQLSQLLSDAPLKYAQTVKTQHESGMIWKQTQWIDAVNGQGIELSKAQQKVFASNCSLIDNQCQEIQKKLEVYKAQVANMDANTKNTVIKNLWEDKIFDAQVRGMFLDNKQKEIAVPYTKALILSELGLANSQIQKNLASARLDDATIGQVHAMVGLIGAQTSGQRFANIMNARYEPDERKQRLNIGVQDLSSKEFNNTWYGRTLNYFSGAIGNIGTAFAAYKVGGLKSKNPKAVEDHFKSKNYGSPDPQWQP